MNGNDRTIAALTASPGGCAAVERAFCDGASAQPCAPISDEIVGESACVQFLKQCIDRVAPTEATVLITGETGTGKELFARRLHLKSNRRSGPLVSINCAAIPEDLIESELFGFEKGAFTGAATRQEGRIAAGNKGTVFLDEIGDLSLSGQAKILRVLEQREVRPLGAQATRPVNIRLVAATNCDLTELIAKGKFRQDLFFRINVINIHVPPLRERREDIPLLAIHFLQTLALQYNRPLAGLTPEANNYLMRQPWAGNVRELRNIVERAFLLSDSEHITEQDIAERFDVASSWCEGRTPETHTSFRMSPDSQLDHRTSRTSIRARKVCSSEYSELDQLRKALEETKWNKSRAAEMLQWSRMTIYRKIVRYDLHPPDAAGAME
jgi:transcriptional regulator with PAS, ATPase and Fis domain